jgi:hypothetical protein
MPAVYRNVQFGISGPQHAAGVWIQQTIASPVVAGGQNPDSGGQGLARESKRVRLATWEPMLDFGVI